MKKLLAIIALILVTLSNHVFAGANKKNGAKNEMPVTIQAKVVGQSDNYTVILLEFAIPEVVYTEVSLKDFAGETLYTFDLNAKAFTKLIKINPEELSKFQIEVNMNGITYRKDFEIKTKTSSTTTIVAGSESK